MHGRTDGQRENSIPPTNKVCGGYNKALICQGVKFTDDIDLVWDLIDKREVNEALICQWVNFADYIDLV